MCGLVCVRESVTNPQETTKCHVPCDLCNGTVLACGLVLFCSSLFGLLFCSSSLYKPFILSLLSSPPPSALVSKLKRINHLAENEVAFFTSLQSSGCCSFFFFNLLGKAIKRYFPRKTAWQHISGSHMCLKLLHCYYVKLVICRTL